ncbi:hypothetical protein K488DRAFT_72691 [Vararia minispora EC-137]|uniref:Uncharacterized protein n=1 Tax=Vararia minispora EC-137 TaxID=1314806 RepID=A0ACB8QDE5_9AGAM|nr:hypothetical protein K488DRAFT_72691 [Vararia minispora EC-137]
MNVRDFDLPTNSNDPQPRQPDGSIQTDTHSQDMNDVKLSSASLRRESNTSRKRPHKVSSVKGKTEQIDSTLLDDDTIDHEPGKVEPTLISAPPDDEIKVKQEFVLDVDLITTRLTASGAQSVTVDLEPDVRDVRFTRVFSTDVYGGGSRQSIFQNIHEKKGKHPFRDFIHWINNIMRYDWGGSARLEVGFRREDGREPTEEETGVLGCKKAHPYPNVTLKQAEHDFNESVLLSPSLEWVTQREKVRPAEISLTFASTTTTASQAGMEPTMQTKERRIMTAIPTDIQHNSAHGREVRKYVRFISPLYNNNDNDN